MKSSQFSRALPTFLFFVVSYSSIIFSQSPTEIKTAMKEAAGFFREELAYRGGYVYFYSLEGDRRLGEGVASATEIWVQAPGTPSVGMAFLAAYSATSDPFYLDAAKEAGDALLYGQLESGGWQNSIDFDPTSKRAHQYRNGKGKGKNYSTLDDGITQTALRFLIQLDTAIGQGQDSKLHEAINYGLQSLLEAQFPNGAFPQVWTGEQGNLPPRPVVPASPPDYDWRTEGRIKEYWNEYTLNDGVAGEVTDLLLQAYRSYQTPEQLEALKSLAEFLLLAQLPAPQAGWAQQYNSDMHPIWARKFEPPAVAGRESMDACESLLKIYALHQDERYLDAVVRGVKYLESSLLPDGQLARYYELKTNRPLYMSRRGDVYSLTYDDSDLPNHYGWKTASRLEEIKNQYRLVRSGFPYSGNTEIQPAAQELISQLDTLGRWVSRYQGERLIGQAKFAPNESYISSETFARNLQILASALSNK